MINRIPDVRSKADKGQGMSTPISDRGGQTKENINTNPSIVSKMPPTSPHLLLVGKFQQDAVMTKFKPKSGNPTKATNNINNPKSMFPVNTIPTIICYDPYQGVFLFDKCLEEVVSI